jgi:hypothetical protein
MYALSKFVFFCHKNENLNSNLMPQCASCVGSRAARFFLVSNMLQSKAHQNLPKLKINHLATLVGSGKGQLGGVIHS